MMTLHYATDSVLMADDVCAALLRYAQALAETTGADLVTVPVVTPDGAEGVAEFLLGPASQLYATPAPGQVGREENPEAVANLDHRAQALHPAARIVPAAAPPQIDLDLS